MTDDEKYWRKDAKEYGWQLPSPAPRWKRLPIIRRLRVAIIRGRTEKHYTHGTGSIGAVRRGYDQWVLYAIDRGWC